MITKSCKRARIEKAVEDPKVIEMVSYNAVSFRNLTEKIATYLESEVRNDVRDFTVENLRNI